MLLDNIFLTPTMKNEGLAHPMSSTLISHLPPSFQYLMITITLLLLKIIILARLKLQQMGLKNTELGL